MVKPASPVTAVPLSRLTALLKRSCSNSARLARVSH